MEPIENNSFSKKINKNDGSIAEIISEYTSHWKWFVLSVIICLSLGVLFILITPKKYQSSLSILLNEDKKGGANTNNDLDLNSLGLLATTNNIDNEIAILSSPDLMRKVVDTLNLRTSYFQKSRLRKQEIFSESPFYATSDYPGTIKLYIHKNDAGFEVSGEALTPANAIKISEQLPYLPAKIKINENTDISIFLTGKYLNEQASYYITIVNPVAITNSLVRNLNVSQTSRTSTVLKLSLTSYNAEKAVAILRELVSQYNEMNVRMKSEMALNSSRYISEQLNEIASELGGVEEEVVQYKQRNNITDLSTESQNFVHQNSVNEQRLMDIETEINTLSLIEKMVNEPEGKHIQIPNLNITDAALNGIINEYNRKVIDYNILTANTGNNNPARQRMEKEMDNIRTSIAMSLVHLQQTYQIAKRDLENQSKANLSRVKSVPEQEKGLLEKVRQQKVKENLLIFLMQKQIETNLSIASTADKARIIVSPQMGSAPISPQKMHILFFALLAGLLLPAAIIYISNLLHTQVRSRNELEKLSSVSIVGQVGKKENDATIVVKSGINSGIAEMFRTLRNNINFILKNQNGKTILLTSTISKEGKTFISINLAASYALSGKKILLIGADIRNPQLKNYLGLSQNMGLTNYLIDDDADWHEYLEIVKEQPNLHILVGGSIPPNPNELLMSRRIPQMLAEAKKEYDFIIIDTAPVGMVSDTYLLSSYADITLYVVREGVTPKAAVEFINSQKEEEKLNKVYLVLNGSSLNKSYRYGYGKDYGYKQK